MRQQEGGEPLGIEAVLQRVMRSTGLGQDLARYQFVKHWQEIVGERIAQRARPECLRRGSLVVRVENSEWAQELSFHKDLILKRLKPYLGKGEEVTDVQFYVSGRLGP